MAKPTTSTVRFGHFLGFSFVSNGKQMGYTYLLNMIPGSVGKIKTITMNTILTIYDRCLEVEVLKEVQQS